ncbi:MAG: tetratricopeptide repeat protein [Myxococcaceae bacterium]
MSSSNTEAWALTAYSHSIYFAEHGGKEEDRQKAREALKHEGVSEEFPHLVLASEYLLSEGKEHESAKAKIIAADEEHAEVSELAGRALLEQGKSEAALGKLKAALEKDPRSVRAMVALADYFLQAEDYAQALDWFDKAQQISEQHPEAIIGTAEARLALKQDLDKSLPAVQAIPDEGLDAELQARKVLAEGRLLSVDGKNDDAISKLSEGSKLFKGKAFEFDLALGEAAQAAGQMEAAQKSFEAALKLKPKSEAAKASLGRVLLARDRPREVLQRISADSGERRVSLVRGVAAAQAGDWKLARAELGKTAVNGKVPAEAVIYLALADAADGELDKAQQVLERALAATRKNKSDVQVALGRVYLQQNKLKEAREQFEAAAADPQDEEGSCALGQLLLRIGMPDRALEPLQKAVSKNPSHSEARHALVRAQLDLGNREDALKVAEAGQLDNPASPLLQKDYALALFRNGKMKEADQASARAVKYDQNDFEANRIRAQVQFARGEGKDAFKSLERANKQNPHDAETFCEIGYALMRQGHPDYALQAFDAAKREGPEAPCASVGPVFARLPSTSKSAVKDLETIIKSAPSAHDRAFALTTLSRVQLSLGSANAAKKSSDDALALEPFSGVAHQSAALVAQKQRDDDKAKEEYAKAAELEPAWGPIRLAYADLLARGSPEDQQKSIGEYEAFLRAGGSDFDVGRVKKQLPLLKKKLAQR